MTNKSAVILLLTLIVPSLHSGSQNKNLPSRQDQGQVSLILHSSALAPESPGSGNRSLLLHGMFYETAQGRTALPGALIDGPRDVRNKPWEAQTKMADGRVVKIVVRPEGKNFILRMSAQPDGDIARWGLAVASREGEYYAGLMERVVDGRQEASWAPGLQTAMDLRGQKIDMIVKPTTSVYAPYYLSSRGYAVFVQGTWPGFFDFCADDPQRVKIEFEGPAFEMKVYVAANPAALVTAHALDAGPPFLPPKWMYTPWRWRDEHSQLMEQEVCGRWLAFSCFTPIMEVGPTRNLAFWSLPRTPSYDAELIAIWRLYARLHVRLADYTYKQAQEAHRTGMPIVRPLFLVDPKAHEAWTNWPTYLYGSDLVVAPIWEKGRRTQDVYLPSGTSWRDAWHPDKIFQGGRTITVSAELHQMPLFIRAGSRLKLGDLDLEYRESLAIARRKPDLKELDAQVKAWFEKRPR